MADDDGKQSFIAVEIADAAMNDAELPTDGSHESHVCEETSGAMNERVAVTVSQGVDMSTGDAQSSSKRVGHEGQSDDSNVAKTVKVDVQKRKRTVVHERAASTDAETPVKRRRVQHNYRRLSSAGYVDDYDGRERFSGKQTTPPAGNSLSSEKSKSADSLSGPMKSRQRASKMTRSQSKMDTSAAKGQCGKTTVSTALFVCICIFYCQQLDLNLQPVFLVEWAKKTGISFISLDTLHSSTNLIYAVASWPIVADS